MTQAIIDKALALEAEALKLRQQVHDQMPGWHRVQDALPAMGEVVLLSWLGYGGKPQYTMGGRVDDSEGWLWGIMHDALVEPGGTNDLEADDDYQPTHWMTLPAPPAVELT